MSIERCHEWQRLVTCLRRKPARISCACCSFLATRRTCSLPLVAPLQDPIALSHCQSRLLICIIRSQRMCIYIGLLADVSTNDLIVTTVLF